MEISLNSNEYVEVRFKPTGIPGRVGELQATPKVTVAHGGATLEHLEDGSGYRIIPGNATGDVLLEVEGSYVPPVEVVKESIVLHVGAPGTGAGGREVKGVLPTLGMSSSKPSVLKEGGLSIQRTADAARSMAPENRAALRARGTSAIEAEHIRQEQNKEASARQDPAEQARIAQIDAATRKREAEHVEREAARLGVPLPGKDEHVETKSKGAK